MKTGKFIPENERWLHTPEVKVKLDQAIARAEERSLRETDLDQLEERLSLERQPVSKSFRDRLNLVADYLDGLRKIPASSLEDFSSDPRNPAAAESLLWRALQAVFDLSRHMTTSEKNFIQDPDLLRALDQLAGFRNRLTHFYAEVTSEELYGILRNHLEDLDRIVEELRRAAAGSG